MSWELFENLFVIEDDRQHSLAILARNAAIKIIARVTGEPHLTLICSTLSASEYLARRVVGFHPTLYCLSPLATFKIFK